MKPGWSVRGDNYSFERRAPNYKIIIMCKDSWKVRRTKAEVEELDALIAKFGKQKDEAFKAFTKLFRQDVDNPDNTKKRLSDECIAQYKVWLANDDKEGRCIELRPRRVKMLHIYTPKVRVVGIVEHVN